MKAIYLIAATAIGLVLAMPLAAHHNSMDPEFIEQMMPDNALDAHNSALEDVLERIDLNDLGNRSMAGSRETEMDPADATQGVNCSVLVGGEECETGNEEGPGMERGPQIFNYPDP